MNRLVLKPLMLKPLALKPMSAKAGTSAMTKAEIPGLVEHLLKAFADRLPPPPKAR